MSGEGTLWARFPWWLIFIFRDWWSSWWIIESRWSRAIRWWRWITGWRQRKNFFIVKVYSFFGNAFTAVNILLQMQKSCSYWKNQSKRKFARGNINVCWRSSDTMAFTTSNWHDGTWESASCGKYSLYR